MISSSPGRAKRPTRNAGYGGLSGAAYLGHAHGAAGIADALLDLFEVTGDERYSLVACRAARWFLRHARPVLADRSGLDWPDQPGRAGIGPFWCHGATGIGQFFLHLAQLGILPEAMSIAEAAARVTARAARWSGPTQCHGLAGNIEFLMDMYQATRREDYRASADLLAHLLLSFSIVSDGAVAWPSEAPTVITPDYTVGFAGVAACLLRLSCIDRLPRQLSRSGFQSIFRASERVAVG